MVSVSLCEILIVRNCNLHRHALSLLSKPQPLFAKVIHCHLKQSELSPSSLPLHPNRVPWGVPGWAKVLHNSSLSHKCTPIVSRGNSQGEWSQGILAWNCCSLGIPPSGSKNCLRKSSASRLVGLEHRCGQYYSACYRNKALNGRWGFPSLGAS